MSVEVGGDVGTVTFTDLQTLTDGLVTQAASCRTEEQLLADWRALETVRNQLAALEHACIIDAEQLGLSQKYAAPNMPSYLRQLLRVSVHEASGRVRAAHAAGPRQTMTGVPVAPEFPLVAAAQARGVISPAHARIITTTIGKLPDAVAEQAPGVEAELVGYARDFDPPALQALAIRRVAYLDPDGQLAEHEYRRRHRDCQTQQRPDGSGTVRIEATAELMERLLTVFDSLAQPRPAADGIKDPRTGGQRRHDAILDLLNLVQRAEVLPTVAGVSATIILTVDAEDWQAGAGMTRTGHGAYVPTAEAKQWAGDADIMTVVLDPTTQAVTGYSDKHRCFYQNQRLAMAVRDKGCSFPGCDRPPQWTEAHHIIERQRGGPTTTDNGTLLCGFHHRNFENFGWSCTMINRIPKWIPPKWLDPTQTPRVNHAHV